MLAASLPTKFNIPFANNAVPTNTNPIPQASQIGITVGAASLVDGWPPVTFIPVGAGGTPPWGRDFNGLFNQITAWTQFGDCAGGLPLFDASFSSAIGGYPKGALIAAIASVTAGSPQGGEHLWLSTADNNTVNPDTVFNSANWVPIPAIIDTPVTYTVHGSSPQFSDLNVAMGYLKRFTITRDGSVTLQIAGATSGVAQVFSYTTPVIIDHPNNGHINILGATMLAAIPTTDASYALTGSSPSARATDSAANIAMVRTRFATELHFTSGSSFEITGGQMCGIDALLITGDGSAAQGLYLNGVLDPQIISKGTSGIAVYNFIGSGGIVLLCSSWGVTGPLLSLGNSIGINVISSFLSPGAPITNILVLSNSLYGVLALDNSFLEQQGAIYANGNGSDGCIAVNASTILCVGGHMYINGQYGSFSDVHSSGSITSVGFFGNGSGDIYANDASIVNVSGSSYSVTSPTVGTVGNNNALITTT